MIGTHWSKGWIIENNVISHSMNSGITLGCFEVEDMPVTVAVDVNGESVHRSGPEKWKLKINMGDI